MATGSSTASRHLHGRATALRKLPGKDAHHVVSDRAAQAARVLDACGGMVPELAAGFRAYVQEKQVAGAARVTYAHSVPEIDARRMALKGSEVAATISITTLIESADDIGTGRDGEALARFTMTASRAAVTFVLTASGIEMARNVADLAGALSDLTDTHGATRHRASQARDASAFLRWIDAVTILAIEWLIRAEDFLQVIQGKRNVPAKQLAKLVAARIQ